MRILIVGSDSNAYTLARTFSNDDNVDLIFVTTGNKYITSDIAQTTDICETDNEELLNFANANEITLTVVTSLKAIENDIAGYFSGSGRNIFAPTSESAYESLYTSACKKTLYKLHIPTVKFGVFDRENQAVNYVSDSRKISVIKYDSNSDNIPPILVNSFSQAKREIEKAFVLPETKIVIEDYFNAKEVCIYFITDGYSALMAGSCSVFDECSYSVYSPDNVLSDEIISDIQQRVVYPYINYCEANNRPYNGILGVNLLISDEEYKVLDFCPFFKQVHLQSILPSVKNNIADLFLSVAVGSFSDEYNNIDFSNRCSYSEILSSKEIKRNLSEYDDDNFFYSRNSNGNVIITETASTYSGAKSRCGYAAEYLTTVNTEIFPEESDE